MIGCSPCGQIDCLPLLGNIVNTGSLQNIKTVRIQFQQKTTFKNTYIFNERSDFFLCVCVGGGGGGQLQGEKMV